MKHKTIKFLENLSQALVTHACNPIYLGGWDQEDRGSKPAQANISWTPISKIISAKWTGSVAQGVAQSHEFKLQSHQKKKILENLNDLGFVKDF
jgi:hypothetical protein